MLSMLPCTLALLLLITSDAYAAPHPSAEAGVTMNLLRKPHGRRTVEDWGEWARSHREMLIAKYGGTPPDPPSTRKRASGTNLLVNQNADSSYYGSLAVGTPPVSYNVILDTGSSDLWLADSSCSTGCRSVPTFDAASSSSFKNLSQPFDIQYGSGRAIGVLGQDSVQMAGFSVANQVFGVCDQVSSGLLSSPVSGLLGLAWQTIASSGATPFWQTLAGSGTWDTPVMAFQLTRFVNDNSAKTLEPGGTFTMGAVNNSLYTGEIDFQNIPSGQVSYWILPLTSLTVQGAAVTVPTGASAYSAIDTGTTLVGGPSATIAQIYAQIPGSAPGTGNFEGYYTYPCSTTVNVSLAFGGQSWSISPSDFKLTALSNTECLGGFFELTTGGNAPSWIVGDTFLKNVYSVFRFNPPSVGFAQLSSAALAMNGVDGAIPSATIGSAAAVTAAGGSGGRSSSGARTTRVGMWTMLIGVVIVGSGLIL
ncbi:hypothetical protein JAAARDRAFT_41815 [Jaapia argillacea MUCL 33604]|uniref:Peptidase A1 domain-containing protein n=1 Tax=Jaapia argillacea MUCL 33604 TaxID=933084 RepID=A0A067P743_9AGAM|nr:hypothetical protein JAAARDRAFT_41815 [Jaapia argillacea MUCL 33604]